MPAHLSCFSVLLLPADLQEVDGPIEALKTTAQVRQEPYKLPDRWGGGGRLGWASALTPGVEQEHVGGGGGGLCVCVWHAVVFGKKGGMGSPAVCAAAACADVAARHGACLVLRTCCRSFEWCICDLNNAEVVHEVRHRRGP